MNKPDEVTKLSQETIDWLWSNAEQCYSEDQFIETSYDYVSENNPNVDYLTDDQLKEIYNDVQGFLIGKGMA